MCRTAECCTVEHGVVGNDIVADARMHGVGHLVGEGIGQYAGAFPLVGNLITALGKVVLLHGLQQIGAGRGQWVAGLIVQLSF